MSISVCMATRGDPRQLASFLHNFNAVRLPAPCELIIVLNTATPPDLVGMPRVSAACRLRSLVEPVPGKGRSLNRAMANATGGLLVFTDDDVSFDPAWLEALWAAARQWPDSPIFGGPIRGLGDVPDWIRRSVNLQGILLSEQRHGEVPGPYPAGHYPFGPNMAVRRAAIERAGARWSESIGPGTSRPVGDEPYFLAQVSPPAAGDRVYVPAAVVHHEVEPGYFRLDRAARRTYWSGWASGRLRARFGGVHEPQSVSGRIAERLRHIASLRELVCNVTRTTGYIVGRYLS